MKKYLFILVLFCSFSACITAKKCREKFPCELKEIERTSDTSKVENPKKAEDSALFSRLQPCPEVEPELIYRTDTVLQPIYKKHNSGVQSVNSYNAAIIDSIRKRLIDSILSIKTTIKIQVKDSASEKIISDYKTNTESSRWLIWQLIKLNWIALLIIAALVIGYRVFLKYVV